MSIQSYISKVHVLHIKVYQGNGAFCAVMTYSQRGDQVKNKKQDTFAEIF